MMKTTFALLVFQLVSMCSASAGDFDRNKYLVMTNINLYEAGRNIVGQCLIIESGDYLGIIANKRQITATTTDRNEILRGLRQQLLAGTCDPTPTTDYFILNNLKPTNDELYNHSTTSAIGRCIIIGSGDYWGVFADVEKKIPESLLKEAIEIGTGRSLIRSIGKQTSNTADLGQTIANLRAAILQGQCSF